MRFRTMPIAALAMLLVAACSSNAASPSVAPPTSGVPTATGTTTPSAAPSSSEIKITFAHSYQDAQPQHACGAKVIADEVAAANTGLSIEVFGQSQLGSDAERISSIVSGDVDMDLQGGSAFGALYPPIGAVDGAFVFDDSDHMYRFFSSAASDPLKQAFYDATGVRILGAWNTGARQFTANKPIRTPADLQGLKMRFPPSPQFLMNAAAMGADAVEVAYEELYLALQQGIADGQENPLTNIKASNLAEVQDYVSLSNHQMSTNLVVIGKVWDELSAEQQKALQTAVAKAMVEEPKCVVTAEQKILDDFRAGGDMQVIDDVDREAFRLKAEPYLREHFTPEQITLLDAIRSTAQ